MWVALGFEHSANGKGHFSTKQTKRRWTDDQGKTHTEDTHPQKDNGGELTLTELLQSVGGAHSNKGVVDRAGQRVQSRTRTSGEKSVKVAATQRSRAWPNTLNLQMGD